MRNVLGSTEVSFGSVTDFRTRVSYVGFTESQTQTLELTMLRKRRVFTAQEKKKWLHIHSGLRSVPLHRPWEPNPFISESEGDFAIDMKPNIYQTTATWWQRRTSQCVSYDEEGDTSCVFLFINVSPSPHPPVHGPDPNRTVGFHFGHTRAHTQTRTHTHTRA